MKRFKAFDPPEYVDWKLDPAALRAFRAALERPGATAAHAKEAAALPAPLLLRLYDGLVRARLHDIALKRWVKQGVISKAWLGTGEEAVTVGNVAPLEDGDAVGPMIRNASAAFLRGIPLADCFRAYLATPDSLSRGRDLHIGDFDKGVVAPISMVASLVPVMAGMALAMRRAGAGRVALTWVGDGASRTGEFHEGMSLAAALALPLVVVLQDNQIALGTPAATHLKAPLDAFAAVYGVAGYACDGNNVVDTYLVTRRAVRACREGKGPALIVARTFRMGGHATHDEAEGRALVAKKEFERWGKRDPVGVYEEWLARGARDLGACVADDGAIAEAAATTAAPARAKLAERNRAALARIETRVASDIASAERDALASRDLPFDDADATDGVYDSP